MEQSCVVVRPPSRLERVMDVLIEVFESHATKYGDRLHLGPGEMGSLFREELGNLIQEASDNPQQLMEILDGLDKDQDGKVNFEEFVSMTVKLVMATTPYFKKYGGLMCGYK